MEDHDTRPTTGRAWLEEVGGHDVSVADLVLDPFHCEPLACCGVQHLDNGWRAWHIDVQSVSERSASLLLFGVDHNLMITFTVVGARGIPIGALAQSSAGLCGAASGPK